MDSKSQQMKSIALAIIGTFGVGAVAVLSGIGTLKALDQVHTDSAKNHNGDQCAYTKKEMIKSSWKHYIPTAIAGAVTVGCIWGSRNAMAVINPVNIAGVMAIAKEVREHQKSDIGEHLSYDIPVDQKLFYDEYSCQYFESTLIDLIQAEYELNRKFIVDGWATLNDFYESIGLEPSPPWETVGWSLIDMDYYQDYEWIDFEHEMVRMDDGLECCIVSMVVKPVENFTIC